MNDSSIPTSRLVTWALWSTTVAFMLTAVGLNIAGRYISAAMVANSGCVIAAAAGVSHIRCIALSAVRSLRSTIVAEMDSPRQNLTRI